MNDLITITFDNNKTTEVIKETSYLDISKLSIYKDESLGVLKNNEISSLSDKAIESETIEFLTAKSIEGAKIYKAGVKFIFEVSLKTVFPSSEVYYLHSVPGGMLGEIVYDKILKNEDISKIKAEMAKIIDEDNRFIKYNIAKKDLIKYYKENNILEKASNININDGVLTMYKLKDYLNYFYVNMPYSTKYIKEFTIKYLDNNRFIILLPSNTTDGKLPEYVRHDNIIKAFYEGASWLKKLRCPYVSDLNGFVTNNTISSFMESCELQFTDQIKRAVDEFTRSNEKKFIMIAGPSSSGKTTTTRVMASYLRSKGYNPLCISTDDYFVEREDTPKDEKGNYDYECLNAIDIELFNNDLLALLKNKEINLPTYNFTTGKKEYHNKKIKLQENSIILIEGLHSLNDDLTPFIPDKNKYKIYLSPFIPLNIDRHNYISTLDLRLIRRIVRDNRVRGHSVISTLKSWQSVRNGEEKYIFPFTHQADIIINTALPYEVGVLKVFVRPLLLSVTTDSPYYEEARRLIKFLNSFYSISSELVEKRSILREFIGGNNND